MTHYKYAKIPSLNWLNNVFLTYATVFQMQVFTVIYKMLTATFTYQVNIFAIIYFFNWWSLNITAIGPWMLVTTDVDYELKFMDFL
jgi:hypothetical protein